MATPKREEAPKEGRWSARKKADAVVRLLRGESLDEFSRELRVEAHRLQAWRDEFLAGGIEGLKARPLQTEDRKLKEAERKIGELTLELEVWQAAARKRGLNSRYDRALRPPGEAEDRPDQENTFEFSLSSSASRAPQDAARRDERHTDQGKRSVAPTGRLSNLQFRIEVQVICQGKLS